MGINNDTGGPYSLSEGHLIGRGWGRFIAIKKSSYKPIPEELKVWFGDNLLACRNKPYTLSGIKGTIGGSESCEQPQIKLITDHETEIYFRVKESYLKIKQPPKKILHLIMSCGRPEYLIKTLKSLDKLDFGDHTVYRVLVDDYPDGRDNEWFNNAATKYNINYLFLNKGNEGLSVVWSNLWEIFKPSDYDYVLHQEDDVVLERYFSIDNWIHILESHPNTCSAVLTRQKWYFHEEETKEKSDDTIINRYRIEWRAFVFSPMMSLYRHSLLKEDIKEKAGFNLNEGMIMQYLRNKGQRCAFIKDEYGQNMITHIGYWFHGKRVLPGEPNYERFAQYDPDKFYCSKSGRPKDK